MKTLRETLDQLDEISRRDLLKGAGAAAGAAAIGGAGYLAGRVSIFEQKAAFALGYCEQFLSTDLPDSITTNYSFKIQLRDYNWWARRLDTKLRTSDDYEAGKNLAKKQLSMYTPDYIKTPKGTAQLIDMFAQYVTELRGNAGYIASLDVKDESIEQVEEASPEALAKIDQVYQK